MTRLILPLLLLCLATSTLAAEFNLKELIPLLQNEFGRSPLSPIVIMDKEELSWRFAQAKAFGDSDKAKSRRLKIIQKYVFEKTQVELTVAEADQYEPFLTVLKEGAFALPILKERYPARYKVCAVFPASEYSNQRLEYERLLGLHTHEAYQGLSFDHLKTRLPYDVLARFSLYHELAHCMDPWYLPATYDYEDPHATHKAETYAEVMALFMLKLEGITEIAQARAEMRTVYSFKLGRYFAQNPQLGFGNPFFVAGGAVYYLAPALIAAEELNPSIEDIIMQTREIVENHALNSRGFTAIVNWLAEPAATWQRYETWASDSPDLFLAAFTTLKDYVTLAPARAQDAFAVKPLTETPTGSLTDLSPELCDAFRQKDHARYLELLAPPIQELRQERGSPHNQARRKKELEELATEMQQSCSAS